MRIFEHPNISSGWKCPICGTNDDKQIALIGIAGTENGRNMEAEQIHIECIDLIYSKELKLLYHKLKNY